MTQEAKTVRPRTSRSTRQNHGSAAGRGSPSSAPSQAACPICLSRDRIEKVSNIVRNGRGRLVWEDGEISHYETELSELLDEPAPPKPVPVRKLLSRALAPLLVLAAILAVLGIIRVQSYVYVPENATQIARNIGLAWFGLLIPSVLIIQFAQARIDHRREMPKWVHARRRWSGLYYCSRDDVVFAPNLKMVASPPEMRSLLYPSESITEEHIQQLATGGLWEATTTE